VTALRSHVKNGVSYAWQSVLSVLVWASWLGLLLLIGLQVWWVTARELAVPDFLLRSLEARLAASNLHATFGHTAFDPSGRLLIEDVKLYSPTFAEPLLTARSIYVRLDPWGVIEGRFEPKEASASGISLFVPAMLSASGKAEPLATNVEATVIPHEHELELRQFTARIGALDLTAHGAVALSVQSASAPASNSLPIADFIARDYPRLSRRVSDYLDYLHGLDQPRLHLELSSAPLNGATVTAELAVKGIAVTQPIALQSSHVLVHTQFPLRGETNARTQLDLSADELRLPNGIFVSDMKAVIRGTFQAAQRNFATDEAELSARSVQAQGFTAFPVAARLSPNGTAWRGSLAVALGGEPVIVSGEVRPVEKSANLHVDARVSPALLAPASVLAKRDLNELLHLAHPPQIEADVTLVAGWKLGPTRARLVAQDLVAHDVPLDFVSADVALDGTTFDATDVVLRTQGDDARGTYTMDTASRDYRFLLEGNLRPPHINGWFGQWWPNFFNDFNFSGPRPQANVDIQGRWGDPRLSLQFLQVHAPNTAIRQVPFDDLRTTLFIRPGFYDATEVYATQGNGFLRGQFLYTVTPGIGSMRTLDFVSTSTIDPREGARIFGTEGTSIVEPFRFTTPPRLQLKGHIDGPAAPNGRHEIVQIAATSGGDFRLFDFPLSNVSFLADLHDDDLSVHDVKMNFADGNVSGHARMWGRGDKRRLSFDVALSNADLGKAVQQVEGYAARRRKEPEPTQSSFDKPGVHLNVTADAEGSYDDLFSFQGKGEAELDGAVLGEVRLLGAMSELFNFTALRFTNMTSTFKIAGPKLEFPDMRLTGANSSVTARGSYALDQKELNFNAKLFPFGESKFIPQLIIGAVLSPLSQFLEVHLTGSLDKPSWEFVRGPRNFLRSLGGSPRTNPAATALTSSAAPATPSTAASRIPSALQPSLPAGTVRTNKELSPYIKR
jgi:hypothetical protein